MPIIEARAVISATDKASAVFQKLAGSFKDIRNSAKSLEGVKPLKGISLSQYASELRHLKATRAEIDALNRSYVQFDNALKSGGPMRPSRYFGAISVWREHMVNNLRAVRTEMDRVEARKKRLWTAMGPIGSGARFMMGAATIAAPAYLANRAMRGTARAGAESLREGARDYLAGMSEEDAARIRLRAGELSAQYPSITAATMHERLRDTAMSMRSVDRALEVADAIAKGTVVLQSLKGKDQAIEEGRKFFRGLDVLGKNQDPKQVAGLFNGFIKAVGVEGADLNLGDVFQVAKQSRAAGLALSDRFLMSTVPGLIGDMGAPQVGTALSSTLAQVVGGRATRQSKAFQRAMGLRDAKGNFLDRKLIQSDPDLYAWNKLMPAMRKRGINTDDETAVTEFLAKAFSNRTVADLFGKLILQAEQYQGKSRQQERSPGFDAAGELPKRDPFVAAEGFVSQLRNTAAALSDPVFPLATSSLNALSGALGTFAKNFSEGDRGQKIGMALGTTILGGGAVAGGVMAARGAYQWFAGTAALNGAAAALTQSAAALTAAAGKMAVANAAQTAAGTATGAAATGAAAGAGGGVFGKIAAAGAGAVPFLPAVAVGAGVVAGLMAYRAGKEQEGTIGLTGGAALNKVRGGTYLEAIRRGINEDRARFGLPPTQASQPVKAEVEGNATLTGNITVMPSPYFMTTVDARIDSKINAIRATGVSSTGTAGSTGRSAPDAASNE